MIPIAMAVAVLGAINVGVLVWWWFELEKDR